jgi:hypothetical protein
VIRDRYPEVPDGDARPRTAASRGAARLGWAARLPALDSGWLEVAAWLVTAKDTLNWLTGVQDEFSEKAGWAVPLGGLAALGRQLVSASSSSASSKRCDACCHGRVRRNRLKASDCALDR